MASMWCILTIYCLLASAMKRIFEERLVPEQFNGLRVDKVAAALFTDFSRNELGQWIKNDALLVNGESKKVKDKIFEGDLLVLKAEIADKEHWHVAEKMDFEVLYEDEHILLVNKPPGLVMHPGAGNGRGTLLNGLLAYRPDLKALPRAGIVHRLDKDTSGVLVIACNKLAYNKLTRMISRREVKRVYHAVCEGSLVSGFDIDRPIGRDPKNRTKQVISDLGRHAFTQIRLLERYKVHTLVQAELKTGRTHQIRVHMSSLGHPLVGDRKYGAKKLLPRGIDGNDLEVVRSFNRQALHSSFLEFEHPFSGEPVEYRASWPQDFLELAGALGGRERF